MDLRVLTWNVSHGRGVPGAEPDPYEEFAAALERWEWDVALLQEVPPRWPDRLRRTLRCETRAVLASRHVLLPLRHAVAVRAPDLMRAGGGASNAILARLERIVSARSAALRRRPQRRQVHGVALACGVWVSNLHASPGPSPASERDLCKAIRVSWEWADTWRLPLILGGALGVRALPEGHERRLRAAASSDADHVLCGDGIEVRPATVSCPERGGLFDHAPLAVTLVI